jgi:hypothetical protein
MVAGQLGVIIIQDCATCKFILEWSISYIHWYLFTLITTVY